MNILVFDTCFNKSYIVLKSDNKILESEIIESTENNYHSVFIIPKIKDILKQHNITIKDIDVIGTNIGPGSFTGIRTGLTIARVFAQQADIKLIGINSLQILSKLDTDSNITLVILDARKNKVYYAAFKNSKVITQPSLFDKEDILNKINQNTKIISDTSIYNYLKDKGINSINYENLNNNLGLNLMSLVEEELKKSDNDYNWAKVKPLYIQKPSITKPKELKNV